LTTNYDFLREHACGEQPAAPGLAIAGCEGGAAERRALKERSHRAAEVNQFIANAIGYVFREYCDERAGFDRDHEDARDILLAARREAFRAVLAGEWIATGEVHPSEVAA
jgi:hypothetical protein